VRLFAGSSQAWLKPSTIKSLQIMRFCDAWAYLRGCPYTCIAVHVDRCDTGKAASKAPGKAYSRACSCAYAGVACTGVVALDRTTSYSVGSMLAAVCLLHTAASLALLFPARIISWPSQYILMALLCQLSQLNCMHGYTISIAACMGALSGVACQCRLLSCRARVGAVS
jgi:hypothetical protein